MTAEQAKAAQKGCNRSLKRFCEYTGVCECGRRINVRRRKSLCGVGSSGTVGEVLCLKTGLQDRFERLDNQKDDAGNDARLRIAVVWAGCGFQRSVICWDD